MGWMMDFSGCPGYGMGGGWGWLGPVLMLLWWIPIAGIVWLVVTRSGRLHHTADARAILAERYARGEIDRDEYDERMKRLR